MKLTLQTIRMCSLHTWLSVVLAGNRLHYPQAWPMNRRHVTTAGETLYQVYVRTPVDNADDACRAATCSPRIL